MISLVNKKFLLVERHSESGSRYANILRSYGVDLCFANTIDDALMQYRLNPDLSIAIVEFDLNSPFDGADLATIMLAKRDIPIVFIFDKVDDGVLECVEAITSYGYLTHDTSETVLIASIKMAIKLFAAKKQLDESESVYKEMFESYPKPLWIFDRITLKFLRVNRAAIEKYGYSEAEFLRMKITDIRSAEEVDKLKAHIDESPNENRINNSGVWLHTKKSGEQINVKILSHPIQWFGKQARMVIVSDIDEKIPLYVSPDL